MTNLDADIIRKMAAWAGDPERYYILDGSAQKKGKLGEWLASYMTAELVVDHYRPEKTLSDLWRWPLGAAIILGALELGALSFIGRIFAKIGRKKSL